MIDTKNIKLEYHNTESGGKQLRAVIGQEVNCIEFTLDGSKLQPIIMTPQEAPVIAFEPYIQFEPKEWSEMIDTILKILTSLWNNSHGENISTHVDTSSVSGALRELANNIEYQFYTKQQVLDEIARITKRLDQWR